MGDLTVVNFDNDVGAFVRECADESRPHGLASARRAVIVYEDDEGTWRTHWMNVTPVHRAYVGALLTSEATGEKAWVGAEEGAS